MACRAFGWTSPPGSSRTRHSIRMSPPSSLYLLRSCQTLSIRGSCNHQARHRFPSGCSKPSKARACASRSPWRGRPQTNPFFEIYQPQYKLSSAVDYIDLPRTTNLSTEILDLAPGIYDFRLFTINSLNLSSPFSDSNGVEIKGLTAEPVAITGFQGQIVGNTALLSWDLHPDLDVRVGGKIEIRHHCDVGGGNSSNSILLAGGTVNGDATFAQPGGLVGTYYIRAIDQQGIAGPFIEWSTDNVRPVPFAQLISGGVFSPNDSNEGLVTIGEAPAWLSTNPANTVEIDRSQNVIKLLPATRISGVTPLFSGITPLVSGVGTLGDVEPQGVYFFFTRLELDAITRMRIEVELDTTIINTEDIFSQRPGLGLGFRVVLRHRRPVRRHRLHGSPFHPRRPERFARVVALGAGRGAQFHSSSDRVPSPAPVL